MLRPILLLTLLCVALRPQPVEACGYSPWSEDSESPQSALRALMLERLPLLSPSWHSEYWVIAWARLEGKEFSQEEVDSLMAQSWLEPSASLAASLEEWSQTRARSSRETGVVDTGAVEVRRRGPNYTYILMCGPDGFRVAAETLRARRQTQSRHEVRRWLTAQDRVFAACAEPNAPEPDEALPGVSEVEAHDRAYQRAVWADHTGHAEAFARYQAIARSSSPWADLARYRSVRLRLAGSPEQTQILAEAIRQTSDAKALRGLRQLQDRYQLFPQGPATSVRTLSARLLAEDLGADLPRTLRDIVHFAKRMDACTTVVSSLVDCETPSEDQLLATMRRAPENVRWAGSSSLLALNAAFHSARASLAAGRRSAAQRYARRAHRLASSSTRASQNAAHAMMVMSGASALNHLLRASESPESRGVLHADGRAWLAGGTVREWQELARRSPELAATIDAHILVRSVLLGAWGRALRYARRLSNGDSAFGRSLQVALASPAAERRGLLLLAVAHHDPTELSITDAFGSHWGTTQVAGCDLGECMDAHPHQTAYAPTFVRSPSTERRRLGARRIDDLGEAVLAHVARHPGSSLNEELLHHFVRLTRRASIHGRTSPRTGELSHAAFDHLHANYENGAWAQRTRHWFR
ncbi:MAG: hypothetical protein AB8H86_34215 [Polyangiales bacterium]